jgi:hypothetical protein
MSGDIGWRLVAYSEVDATHNGTSFSVVELQHDGNWLIRICNPNSYEPPLLERLWHCHAGIQASAEFCDLAFQIGGLEAAAPRLLPALQQIY